MLASVRQRVQFVRREIWFPLLVFGVVTALSTPLYWRYGLTAANCNYQITAKCANGVSKLPSSGFLAPDSGLNGLSSWLTPYWILAFTVGFSLSIWHFNLRAKKFGVRRRFRLAAAVGVLLIVAVAVMNLVVESLDSQSLIDNDMWIRGTASLVILAIFFVAVAVVDRSFSFLIYS